MEQARETTSNLNAQRIVETWKSFERAITVEEDRVIKRELADDELLRRANGAVVRPFWGAERLRNEAATLQLIAARTTIPVPRCRLYVHNGLVHLETERIRETEGVRLIDIEAARRPQAAAAVDAQIRATVLPQLRALRRASIGSVDPALPVFPPQRVYDRDRRPWPRITAEPAAGDAFVLCHNDLGPQNIFVHRDTFELVGIIDWEFSGYFPAYFELPLWTAFAWKDEQALYEAANRRELAFFGLEAKDLEDCIPPP
ncbi:aminoglycoside phosphotransferase [Niveomyces insectorum RCEF 264]|uniref:Aminoglycoside phosphotransferase n=1 Tax=Niveomyces insectorum RCEF 264 TaxID=1081102 RepID=A0A167PH56_9HYPO|nr:aminoglycoside phosphotransferase [Niveomyces insectorum RCEF 264]